MRGVVSAVLAMLVAVALAACGGSDSSSSSSASAAGNAASGAPAAAAGACPASGTPHVVKDVALEPGVRALSVDGARVWVANVREGTVTSVDGASGRVEHRVRGFRAPVAIAAGLGSVFVADQDKSLISTISPATGAAKPLLGLDVPVDVAIVGEQVWFMSLDDGSVTAYAPSAKVVSVPDLGLPVRAPVAMAPLGSTLWVLGSADHSVLPLDTGLKRVVEGGTPLVANSLSDIAAGAGGVWVADPKDFSILRVDPGTRAVTAFHAPRPMRPSALAVGPCGVWAADPSGLVARFDPATLRVIGTPVDIGRSASTVVTDGGNGIWVTDDRAGHLLHVSP